MATFAVIQGVGGGTGAGTWWIALLVALGALGALNGVYMLCTHQTHFRIKTHSLIFHLDLCSLFTLYHVPHMWANGHCWPPSQAIKHNSAICLITLRSDSHQYPCAVLFAGGH